MHDYLDPTERAPYWAPLPPAGASGVGGARTADGRAGPRRRGAHPYFVSVERTRRRAGLGPGKLLAPEQAVVLATNRGEARAIRDRHTHVYQALDNYRQNLLRPLAPG
jgi:hypothetical protein